jgi:hypothetical protein
MSAALACCDWVLAAQPARQIGKANTGGDGDPARASRGQRLGAARSAAATASTTSPKERSRAVEHRPNAASRVRLSWISTTHSRGMALNEGPQQGRGHVAAADERNLYA